MMHGEASAHARLVVDAAPTVRAVEAIQAELRDLLARHSAVEIDCGALQETDVSFIQLLLSAKRTAELSGKSIALTAPAAGPLRAALLRGGFVGAVADGSNPAEAFWLKGSSGQ